MAGSVDCSHCGKTGTCGLGEGGVACDRCVHTHELRGLKSSSSKRGLWCGVCGGTGVAEPFSVKLQSRVAPFVAIGIILGILVLAGLIAYTAPDLRPQVLTLAGTLGGAVTGYYFSGKQS